MFRAKKQQISFVFQTHPILGWVWGHAWPETRRLIKGLDFDLQTLVTICLALPRESTNTNPVLSDPTSNL